MTFNTSNGDKELDHVMELDMGGKRYRMQGRATRVEKSKL